jgi:hypothetical protein
VAGFATVDLYLQYRNIKAKEVRTISKSILGKYAQSTGLHVSTSVLDVSHDTQHETVNISVCTVLINGFT